MPEPVISARNVRKQFIIHSESATSLKERILRQRASSRKFDALHDLTVDIDPGSTVGLIGPNGSGKSTTLKLLAGILRPTSGSVRTRGRIASLLELGAGFNGELSGRENVYLNASLLGLTRKETDAIFDQILTFSELEEFIDNPVKHYSSGMYVRLGFAVAVHVDPDVLLVDEVLAVGDEHFQRKCMEKIREFQREGRTILFVTHSLGQVEELCDRALVLDHGNLVFDGAPQFATEHLRKILGTEEGTAANEVDPSEDEIIAAGLALDCAEDPEGPTTRYFAPGQPILVRAEFAVSPTLFAALAAVKIVVMGVGDLPIWVMHTGRDDLPTEPGLWRLIFRSPHCPPLGGRYVAVMVLEDSHGNAIMVKRSDYSFQVTTDHQAGILGVDYSTESGVISERVILPRTSSDMAASTTQEGSE